MCYIPMQEINGVLFYVSEKPTELLKLAKLTHGDSLDDVEGFPEDHVAEYVHKLPHIAETR